MSRKHQTPARVSNPTPTRTATVAAQFTSGPLPDAQRLQAYKDLDPQLYEMIKTDYAANGEHRRDIEKMNAETNNILVRRVTANDRIGIVLSWTFGMFCVGGAFWFMAHDKPNGALIAVLGLLPPVIAAMRRMRAPKQSK